MISEIQNGVLKPPIDLFRGGVINNFKILKPLNLINIDDNIKLSGIANKGNSIPSVDLEKINLQSRGAKITNSSKEKIEFTKTINLQDGVDMYIPKNPVKSDGTVDIIIQFRGIVPKGFSEGGVNAIVIGAETKGLSAAMMEKFGYKNFVPQILEKAMSEIKKKYGNNVQIGRLALGSFSAGYAPLAVALSDPVIRAKTDAVIVIDGIHYGKAGFPNPQSHKPFVDFARESVNGNKLMVITHSSIRPNYSSSTDAANYIASQVGAKRIPVTDQSYYQDRYKNRYGSFISPSTRIDLNGFHVEGYEGNVAKSHVEQIDNLGNIWNEYLAPRWK